MIIGQTVCFPGGHGSLSALMGGVAYIQTPEGLVQKPATEVRVLEEPPAPETPLGINPETGEETRDTAVIPPEPGDNLEVGVVETVPLGTCIVASEGPLGPDSPSSYPAEEVQCPLPARITAKWLRERSPEELRVALGNPDLFGPRRERVKKELEGRGL